MLASAYYLIDFLREQQRIYVPPHDTFTGLEAFSNTPTQPAVQQRQELPQPPSEQVRTRASKRIRKLPSKFDDCVVDLPGIRKRPEVPIDPPTFNVVPNTAPHPRLPAMPAEAPGPILRPQSDQGLQAIRTGVQLAIDKLLEYIQYMEACPIYWATMILHPGCKLRWLDKNFPPERVASIRAAFQKFVIAYCRKNPLPRLSNSQKQRLREKEQAEASLQPQESQKSQHVKDMFANQGSFYENQDNGDSSDDEINSPEVELDSYLRRDAKPVHDPI